MARQLESEVEVQASPERVWEVLTNFAAYPDWNPFIVRVLEAEPARRLRWLGHLLVPGLFDGEHR
ncbi:MAG TPA: SRPBCC family protein, partial [Actinomycetota bacterium]|nr:SRPBCC family protein [Actinomycetota bacterium]